MRGAFLCGYAEYNVPVLGMSFGHGHLNGRHIWSTRGHNPTEAQFLIIAGYV
jgi:hypothetical protein